MGVSLMKVGYLGGGKGGADCERRLEWFGYWKGRLKTENVKAVVIMKMKGSAQVEMELHCQKGHDSLEGRGGTGH